MFNADIKQKYIRQRSDSIAVRKSHVWLFDATEPYEVAANKDVCEMNTRELQNMIDGITGVRYSGRKTRIWLLKTYIEWCANNGFPDATTDAINSITHQNIDKIRERTVKSPFHLQSYLNSIFLPEASETTDNVFRCYLWLAYAGIPEDNALDVSASDVDFGRMVIRYNGEEFPIYREAVAALQNCVKLGSFAYIHPNYNNVIFQPRKDGNKILRLTAAYSETTGSVTTPHQYRQRLAQAYTKAIKLGKTDIKLTYKSALDSGMFYRVHELESIGATINFTMMFDDGFSNKQRAKDLANRFKKDYENWKMTL